MKTRTTGTKLALLALPLGTQPALAQSAAPAARAQAVELFDSATSLFEAKRYAEACPKFAESYRLEPQLGVALHLADCLEHNGQFASAYAAFRDASELAAKKGDERQQLADEHAAVLKPKLSRLTINIPDAARLPGLNIGRDGIALAPAAWGTPIAVDPGEHHLIASAPGRKPWETTLTVPAEAGLQTIDIPILEAAPPEPARAQPSPEPERTSDSGSTQRLLGYVAGGVGAVGIGVGIGFAIRKGNKIDQANAICPAPTNQCPPGTLEQSQTHLNQLTSDARTAGTISSIGFVAGAVALAGGVVLIVTAPRTANHEERGAFRLAPWFGPGGAGIAADRSF